MQWCRHRNKHALPQQTSSKHAATVCKEVCRPAPAPFTPISVTPPDGCAEKSVTFTSESLPAAWVVFTVPPAEVARGPVALTWVLRLFCWSRGCGVPLGCDVLVLTLTPVSPAGCPVTPWGAVPEKSLVENLGEVEGEGVGAGERAFPPMKPSASLWSPASWIVLLLQQFSPPITSSSTLTSRVLFPLRSPVALSADTNNEVLRVTLSSVLLRLTVSLTSLLFLCDVTVLVKSCLLLPTDPFVAGKNNSEKSFLDTASLIWERKKCWWLNCVSVCCDANSPGLKLRVNRLGLDSCVVKVFQQTNMLRRFNELTC